MLAAQVMLSAFSGWLYPLQGHVQCTPNLTSSYAPGLMMGFGSSCSLGAGADQSMTASMQDPHAANGKRRRVNPQTAAFRASFAQAAAAAAEADLVTCAMTIAGLTSCRSI